MVSLLYVWLPDDDIWRGDAGRLQINSVAFSTVQLSSGRLPGEVAAPMGSVAAETYASHEGETERREVDLGLAAGTDILEHGFCRRFVRIWTAYCGILVHGVTSETFGNPWRIERDPNACDV